MQAVCAVFKRKNGSLRLQNFNVGGEVQGRALGTRLKYPKPANDRASLTARIYPQLPRLKPNDSCQDPRCSTESLLAIQQTRHRHQKHCSVVWLFLLKIRPDVLSAIRKWCTYVATPIVETVYTIGQLYSKTLMIKLHFEIINEWVPMCRPPTKSNWTVIWQKARGLTYTGHV